MNPRRRLPPVWLMGLSNTTLGFSNGVMNWRSTAGLPLGLSPEFIYAETDCRLDHGTRLNLLSDGIVEARNAAGELFGFERTLQLSNSGVNAIAQAAIDYGQEDDITVLTLTLVPETVPHA